MKKTLYVRFDERTGKIIDTFLTSGTEMPAWNENYLKTEIDVPEPKIFGHDIEHSRDHFMRMRYDYHCHVGANITVSFHHEQFQLNDEYQIHEFGQKLSLYDACKEIETYIKAKLQRQVSAIGMRIIPA